MNAKEQSETGSIGKGQTPFSTKPNLIELQQASGGLVREDASTADDLTVVHFGDPAAEFLAATEDAALFDLSNRTQIEITGSDRHQFLHNFCTNDIKGLEPGRGCEAFLLNVKGRVLGHVFVFNCEQSLWLESAAGSSESLMAHLDRYIITEDVQLHDRTAEYAELLISGPNSLKSLQSVGIVCELSLLNCVLVDFDGQHLQIRHVDWLNSVGFLLSMQNHIAPEIWRRLIDTKVQTAGEVVFHALRIEAGMPIYGRDITDGNLAQEVARNRQAISFTKGCYLGQEPVARIDAMGHVNRELRGLRIDAESVPPVGAAVISEDEKEIGGITSSACSFRDNKPIALAYLRSAFTTAGTAVRVATDAGPVNSIVYSNEPAD